jgi:quercetin dioxygenase-like cupin family protein
MYVSKGAEVKTQRVDRPIFTGEVHQGQHVTPEHAEQHRIGLVSFKPGGRTKWHTHPWEQVLVVTEGKGIVATRDKEYVIIPGDVAVIPTGEEHWHGATDTTGMTHVAINQEGEAVILDPVTKVQTQNP